MESAEKEITSMSPSDATKGPRERVVSDLLPQYDLRCYIGGRFVDSDSQLSLQDPLTGSAYGAVGQASTVDVSSAVEAAVAGGRLWASLHPRARSRLLIDLAEAIEERLEDLAALEALDTGKRFAGTRGWDIGNAAEVYRYYGGWADKISGELLPTVSGQRFDLRPEPAGVVAALVAWNFPFPCMAWKVAPALATGCSVVLKPSERAPLSAHLLANLADQVGLPPGVLNVISGGPEVGEALVRHNGVDRVTFTGSSATAQRISESAGGLFARSTFELGGKSPAIVFEDSDLDRAARGVFEGLYDVAGQNCCSTNRVVVHRSVRDELVARLAALGRDWKIGDNFDDAVNQGPQIDAAHLDRIAGYVRRARESGGSDVLGLDVQPAPWFAPVLIENVALDAEISVEEVFGPVGSLYTFDSDDEALEIANASAYGLAASLWTTSRSRISRFSRELRVGTVWVNCFGYFDSVAPWGGRGMSGSGRELGEKALEEFIEWKTVVEVD
ncbi:MAG: aldehyde dehydrogenase [Acidimicrobiales bacterium]|nr:aldehyde dehydrogenase [Acidimicrobiales bacterium]